MVILGANDPSGAMTHPGASAAPASMSIISTGYDAFARKRLPAAGRAIETNAPADRSGSGRQRPGTRRHPVSHAVSHERGGAPHLARSIATCDATKRCGPHCATSAALSAKREINVMLHLHKTSMACEKAVRIAGAMRIAARGMFAWASLASAPGAVARAHGNSGAGGPAGAPPETRRNGR